jgi:hypothetical protein
MLSNHDKLVHAVTAYDRKRQGKRGYNIWALPQYLGAVERVETDIAKGIPLRQALVSHLSDRLLDACLKAVGESKATLNELHYGR